MTKSKKNEAANKAVETITSYKGFDKNLQCRGFQYEIGKTFKHKGKVKACGSGFHACEYPLDVFGYYAPGELNRFAVVEQSGDLSRGNDDTKVASKSITIKAEVDIPFLVKAAIEYTTSRCEPIKEDSPAFTDKDHGQAVATGDNSASSATGDNSASSATGYNSASSATGDNSASLTTGHYSASSATGDNSASSATGYKSASLTTGHYSASSATGDNSASSATGYKSASSATGDNSASSATGDNSASSATGNWAASLTTGHYSESQIKDQKDDQYGVAISIGYEGKAKASEGSAIVLTHRNSDGEILHIRASKVGENGVKADTWYQLDANGQFVEAN
ncbi:TPA: DUF7666 domain-containing protein [Acinetobacter baumannii]|uniref:DUF7666 domain-containing protein n=1 Tax=Acinetobacter baumannii TaxID=470 RepID=UPI001C052765|nr:hypothetical protein [Acinetobacter baumannii]MBU0345053.1 hypothetical protein [Acinetobacter baumannii]MCF4194291.1 hypothetical protein [Acinetobacter baumannii]UMN97973.1 hypothetical protein L2Z30_08340 [Acinetobacter baumannii]HCQ9698579.1 hypothetical protein [Acinetobacter baumannii]HCQ9707480.1 hypothetical protein [Acinetobacter baumannii]